MKTRQEGIKSAPIVLGGGGLQRVQTSRLLYFPLLLVRFLPLALWFECQNITNCCVIFPISPAFHTFRILTSCPFLLPPTPLFHRSPPPPPRCPPLLKRPR